MGTHGVVVQLERARLRRLRGGLPDGRRRGDLTDDLGVVLPGVGGKHAVGDPVRQFVRPLVNGLVRDADGFGRGRDGAAKKFEGFGLAHSSLNHSSEPKATIVHADSASVGTMVETTFLDRLAMALDIPSDGAMHSAEHRA